MPEELKVPEPKIESTPLKQLANALRDEVPQKDEDQEATLERRRK